MVQMTGNLDVSSIIPMAALQTQHPKTQPRRVELRGFVVASWVALMPIPGGLDNWTRLRIGRLPTE